MVLYYILKKGFFNLFITSLLEIYNLNRSKTSSKTILFKNYFFNTIFIIKSNHSNKYSFFNVLANTT